MLITYSRLIIFSLLQCILIFSGMLELVHLNNDYLDSQWKTANTQLQIMERVIVDSRDNGETAPPLTTEESEHAFLENNTILYKTLITTPSFVKFGNSFTLCKVVGNQLIDPWGDPYRVSAFYEKGKIIKVWTRHGLVMTVNWNK